MPEDRWEPTEESLRAAGHAEIDFGNFEDAKILFEWADYLAEKKLDAEREASMEGGE